MFDHSFKELTGLISFSSISSLRHKYSDEEIKKQAILLSDQFEVVKKKIDSDIDTIIERLSHCDPLRTLMIATDLVMQSMINKVSESQITPEISQIVRYIEYVQSIFVTHKLYDKRKIFADDNYIYKTLSFVEDLYKKSIIFVDYLAAKLYVDGQYSAEEIDYIVESYRMRFVRGNRYRFQQLKNIEVLLQPHSDELFKLYGVTSDDLLKGLQKLEVSLSSGKIDASIQFGAQADIAMESDNLDEYLKNIQSDKDNPLWPLLDKVFGYAVYDVKQVTGWPDKFTKSLSFELGELSNTNNKRKSDFDNWPFKDLPVQKKPFININGIFYCFDYYNLFDNIYRVIQKTINEEDCTYATKWANLQQKASENLVANMFKKLLPGSEVYVGNYYPDENHPKQYAENDILIIYDTCVFIIEVKAGSFTYTPAATDFNSHIKSLENLIKKADYQCNRTLNYINQCAIANFYKTNNKKSDLKFIIDKKKYHYFFTFCITVDNFNAIEAKIDKAHFLNINSGTLAISVDDLDIYTEFFDSPLIFLHYLKHRQVATKNPILYLNDELDHLGLYIKHNDYNGYVSRQVIDENPLAALGYRRSLDAYFAGIHDSRLKIDKPKQEIPQKIIQILEFLEVQKKPNRVDFANFLLDMSSNGREHFSEIISYVINKEEQNGNLCPFAIDGDFFMCCFVIVPSVTILPQKLMNLHTYSLFKDRNKEQGWQIILSYNVDRCINDIYFKEFYYYDYSKEGFSESEIMVYLENLKPSREIKNLK